LYLQDLAAVRAHPPRLDLQERLKQQAGVRVEVDDPPIAVAVLDDPPGIDQPVIGEELPRIGVAPLVGAQALSLGVLECKVLSFAADKLADRVDRRAPGDQFAGNAEHLVVEIFQEVGKKAAARSGEQPEDVGRQLTKEVGGLSHLGLSRNPTLDCQRATDLPNAAPPDCGKFAELQ
jgi:hypothetical protein